MSSPSNTNGTTSNSSNNNSSSTTATPATPVRPPAEGATDPPAIHSPTPLPSAELDESLPKYKRDLVAKQKMLRAELQALQPQSGHCRLEVSRSEIFEVRIRLWSTNFSYIRITKSALLLQGSCRYRKSSEKSLFFSVYVEKNLFYC